MTSKEPIRQEEQFVQVIERHKGILYKVVRSYCRDEEERKDLLQEIVYQMWKSFERYDPQYAYSTWIYRIALNVAISSYRKSSIRKNHKHPITESILEFPDEVLDPEKEQQVSLLYQFIQELKE